MPLAYELLLRSRTGAPPDAERLDAALVARGLAEAEGSRALVSPHGRIAVREPEAGAGSGGIDLAVPAAASSALAEDLCTAAFGLAKDLDLQVFDPQLGRVVTPEETAAVVARLGQQGTYYTETVGIDPVDGRLRPELPSRGLALTGRGKFYLAVAGILVALAVLAQLC